METEFAKLNALYQFMGMAIKDIESCDDVEFKECMIKALTDTLYEAVSECIDARYEEGKDGQLDY